MALFGLIDDKFCSICGNKIGLLGNRKLDDGNLCKDCAAQLSPWLVGRRSMMVDDIRAHLDYRAENRNCLDSFTPTRVLGRNMKIYIDDNQSLVFFSRSQNWRNENPDILRFDQITGCTYEVKEYEHEETVAADAAAPGRVAPPPGRPGAPAGRPPMAGRPTPPPPPGRANVKPTAPGRPGAPAGRPPMPGRPGAPAGRPVPPPQAARAPMPPTRVAAVAQRWYSYDFKMTVYVNSEWFQEVHFDINDSSVRDQGSVEYNNCLYEAEEIRNALLGVNQSAAASPGGYDYQVEAVACPWCGATTMPSENNCCEYCGGTLAGQP